MKYSKEFKIKMIKKKKNGEPIPINENYKDIGNWHNKIRKWEKEKNEEAI